MIITQLNEILNSTNVNDIRHHIALYFKKNACVIPTTSITQVANECHVSKSMIVKFVKELGYEGYIDFKNNKFKLGNSLTYEEIDESGSLKIVGEITANMFRCPFKTISGVVNKNTFDNSTNLIFSAIEQTHLLLDKDSKWDGVTINVYYPGYYENKLKGTNNASIIEGIIMWPDKSVNQNNEWTTYNQIYLRKGPVFITFIYINNFWIITKAIGDISTTLNDI